MKDCWWDVKNQIKQNHLFLNPVPNLVYGVLKFCSFWTQENLSSGFANNKAQTSLCTSVQSDQRLCYSIYVKYSSQTWSVQNFNILTCLCSWVDWTEYRFVGNPNDTFCHIEAHFGRICFFSRFITREIIYFSAMSFASEEHETTYKYNLKEVTRMLKTKHADNYMVRWSNLPNILWDTLLTLMGWISKWNLPINNTDKSIY